MKTEDFDDAIRKKLEGVDQQYNEHDIDKVFAHVKANMRVPFMKRYGKTVLYVSSVAAIVVLIVWNGLQYKENSQLRQKINTIQNQLSVTVQKVTAPQAKQLLQTENTSQQQAANAAQTALTNGSKPSLAAISGIVNSSAPAVKAQYNVGTLVQNNSGYTSQPNAIGHTTSEKEIVPTYVPAHAVTQNNLQTVALTDTSNNLQQETSKDVVYNVVPKATTDNDTAQQAAVRPKQKPSSSLSLGNLFPKIGNPFTGTTAESPSNNMSIKNLRFRGGAAFELANNQLGLGLTGEMLLSRHWGVSAGVRFLNIKNESYHDDIDFHKRKGMHFNNVNDTSAYNIGMHTVLMQVPVSVTFQLPMKNKFALIAAAGTDIDLYSRQYINYMHRGSEVAPQQLTANYPIVHFNNMMFSVGLQKRSKNMVFQVSPFISPQVTSVLYKKENLYAGVRLDVLFTNE